jgi:hypothetical protein
MMRIVDHSISFNDSSRIFQHFDNSDGFMDGKLTMTEFLEIFTQYDFADLNDRAGRFIFEIREIIRYNNIDIFSLFR